MAYIEFLRVKRAMMWVLILLGLSVVAAIILRVSLGGLTGTPRFGSSTSVTHGVTTTTSHMESRGISVFSDQTDTHPLGTTYTGDADAVVSKRTLANGNKQTIIVDPHDNSTVVYTHKGYFGGTDIDIISPPGDAAGHYNKAQNLSVINVARVTAPFDVNGYHFNVKKPMEYVKIRTNADLPIWIFFIGASITGLIIATILSVGFAAQNDGHLELAFTRPAAREFEALRAIGVDIAGIVTIMIVQGIVAYLSLALWVFPHASMSVDDVRVLLLEMLVPLAWYAFTLAATASMKRGYGALAGILWPISFAVLAFGAFKINNSVLLVLLYRSAGFVSHFLPLYYANVHAPNNAGPMFNVAAAIPDLSTRLLILAALTVGYSAVAIFQWRRVEA